MVETYIVGLGLFFKCENEGKRSLRRLFGLSERRLSFFLLTKRLLSLSARLISHPNAVGFSVLTEKWKFLLLLQIITYQFAIGEL